MADNPVNPIGAEFGKPNKIQPVVPPLKPGEDVDTSEAFKAEMEKKSRRVNEKEREEQRSATQEEHELAAVKPLIKQALDQEQAEKDNILQPQTPSSDSNQQTSTPTSSQTPAKTKVATTSSDSSKDLPQEDTHLLKKLPEPPPSSNAKEEVQYVPKKMAPPPLTTPTNEGTKTPVPEKKIAAPIQTSSSKQGDAFSQQKPNVPQEAPKPASSPAPMAPQKPQMPKQADAPTSTTPPLKELMPKSKAPEPKVEAPAPQPVSTAKPAATTPKPVDAPQQTAPEQSTSPSEKLSDLDTTLSAPETPTPSFDPSKTEGAASVSPFETPYTAQKKDDVIRTSRQELELGEGPSSVTPPPQSDFSGGGSKQDEKEKQEQAAASQHLLDTVFPTDLPQTPFQEAVGFDRLPPHVLDLFDRIVGVITVMQLQGKTETTLHINQPGSLIQGAEVIITHMSTAPGSYNIELKGSPEAIVIFQQNVEQLKKSFQRREEENKLGKKEFNFKIHDIRISLKDDKST